MRLAQRLEIIFGNFHPSTILVEVNCSEAFDKYGAVRDAVKEKILQMENDGMFTNGDITIASVTKLIYYQLIDCMTPGIGLYKITVEDENGDLAEYDCYHYLLENPNE